MSDIHGRNDLFEKMLEQIHFDVNKDFLYILGDVIDRGGDLTAFFNIKEMVNHGCCEFIMGNHEADLLSFLTLYNYKSVKDFLTKQKQSTFFSAVTKNINGSFNKIVFTIANLKTNIELAEQTNALIRNTNYMFNNNMETTATSLSRLSDKEITEIRFFLQSLPLKKEITFSNHQYVLVHGGFTIRSR